MDMNRKQNGNKFYNEMKANYKKGIFQIKRLQDEG